MIRVIALCVFSRLYKYSLRNLKYWKRQIFQNLSQLLVTLGKCSHISSQLHHVPRIFGSHKAAGKISASSSRKIVLHTPYRGISTKAVPRQWTTVLPWLSFIGQLHLISTSRQSLPTVPTPFFPCRHSPQFPPASTGSVYPQDVSKSPGRETHILCPVSRLGSLSTQDMSQPMYHHPYVTTYQHHSSTTVGKKI